MKAIQYRRYGAPDVLSIDEVGKPVPGDGEVLIRVRASSVNPYDWHYMRGTPYLMRIGTGLRKPKGTRLGVDVAGEVEAVGKGVTRLKPGDAVFGGARGAWAEYVCAPERALVTKPENITFEEAGAVAVAGLTALQAMRTGKVEAGKRVLINGAAGGVGTFAVQIAKALGAEVTGVCSSGSVELVRSIGAAEVFDYTREDFTKSGRQYDTIIDCVCNHPFFVVRRVLGPNGIHALVGGTPGRWLSPFPRILAELALSKFVSQKMAVVMTKSSTESLTTLRGLMEEGELKPVIERRYALGDIAEAVRHQEQGHARGKVVVTVS